MWEVGVKMPKLDLDDLLYNQLNFAYSEREPSSCARFIARSGPYYYRWNSLTDGSTIDF